jgi:putative hydrolase of the HAD superfamily
MSQARRPARVETVLLDAGGVLLDLDYAYVRRLLTARGHATFEANLAQAEARARTEVDRRVRAGGRAADAWRDYFRLLLREAGFPVDLREEVIDALWEAHQRVGIWTCPIPGALDAVREIRARGFRLGVVSNAEGRVEQDLQSAGFGGLFDVVVDSHRVGVEKPDPAIFRIALERLGAAAETTVFVGDVPAIDVAGAQAAGITPLLLDRFDLYADAPIGRLRSLAELPPWLDGLAQNVQA